MFLMQQLLPIIGEAIRVTVAQRWCHTARAGAKVDQSWVANGFQSRYQFDSFRLRDQVYTARMGRF